MSVNMYVYKKGADKMTFGTWQNVCYRCDKDGHKNKYVARPTVNSPPINGKSPANSDGKHKPLCGKVKLPHDHCNIVV